MQGPCISKTQIKQVVAKSVRGDVWNSFSHEGRGEGGEGGGSPNKPLLRPYLGLIWAPSPSPLAPRPHDSNFLISLDLFVDLHLNFCVTDSTSGLGGQQKRGL